MRANARISVRRILPAEKHIPCCKPTVLLTPPALHAAAGLNLPAVSSAQQAPAKRPCYTRAACQAAVTTTPERKSNATQRACQLPRLANDNIA